MDWREIDLLVAIPAFAVVGIYGAILNIMMINKLNEVLPSDRRFQQLGWWAGKHMRFDEEYRKTFPADNLMLQRRMVFATGIAFFAMAGTAIFLR